MPPEALPLLIVAGAIAVLFRSLLYSLNDRKKLRKKVEWQSAYAHTLLQERKVLQYDLSEANQHTASAIQAADEVHRLLDEQSQHFPWLADAFGDLQELRFQREEDALRYKQRPAISAADKVSELKKVARETQRQFRLTKYRIQFYEKLFPWLTELSGEDITTLIKARSVAGSSDLDDDDTEEPAKSYLSEPEWNAKTRPERYQIALDRWKSSPKSKWQIGRDFERFCGYQLEISGYDVEYYGAIEGFDDLGRDLIARKSDQILIIQCKYWSSEKLVHEKHVFQTFATALEYALDNNLAVSRRPIVGPRTPDLATLEHPEASDEPLTLAELVREAARAAGEKAVGEALSGLGEAESKAEAAATFDAALKLSGVTPMLVVSCALSERARRGGERAQRAREGKSEIGRISYGKV
jgi:hypothetical protein